MYLYVCIWTGTYKYILVCTNISIYWYVLVHTSIYKYVLVYTGMYWYISISIYNGTYYYVDLWVHAMKAPLWHLEGACALVVWASTAWSSRKGGLGAMKFSIWHTLLPRTAQTPTGHSQRISMHHPQHVPAEYDCIGICWYMLRYMYIRVYTSMYSAFRHWTVC